MDLSQWTKSLVDHACWFIDSGAAVLQLEHRWDSGETGRGLCGSVMPRVEIDLREVPGALAGQGLVARCGEEAFDAVFVFGVLERCRDWRDAASQLTRILAGRGLLVILVGIRDPARGDDPSVCWRFTAKDLFRIFSPVGEILHEEELRGRDGSSAIGIVLRRSLDRGGMDGWVEALRRCTVAEAGSQLEDRSETILFDQYSRYRACAAVLSKAARPGDRILDVGSGESCLLERFLPERPVTYLDPLLDNEVERAANRIAGDIDAVELDGQRFDFAVAVDTLEHIPAEDRRHFVARLAGLARRGVVLAFPASDEGSPTDVDRRVAEVYEEVARKPYPWLEEHFEFGLPRLDETVRQLQEERFGTAVAGHGHVPWLQELLAFTVCGLEVEDLRPAVWELSELFNRNLATFDGIAPHYRQVIYACRDRGDLFDIRDRYRDEDVELAMAGWKELRGTMLSRLLRHAHTRSGQGLSDGLWAERLRADLNRLYTQRENLRRREEQLERQLAYMRSSLSWRLTRPLRRLRKLWAMER